MGESLIHTIDRLMHHKKLKPENYTAKQNTRNVLKFTADNSESHTNNTAKSG